MELPWYYVLIAFVLGILFIVYDGAWWFLAIGQNAYR
jgi:hypothetical protein